MKAIVIGSGIAGLASAIRLRKKGYELQVFETNNYTGGKLHAIKEKGYRFDMGPSLFTMPHLVDELFELHDIDPRKHFNYHRKSTVCNYFWEDNTRFTVPSDDEAFVSAAAERFDVSKEKLSSYLKRNKNKYDLTAGIFLNKSLHKWDTFLSLNTLKSLLQAYKLDLSSTLNEVNEGYFDNTKLVQLFNRYATYNGSSPYKTPGIMSLIPHLEMHFGTFYPEGGMHSISQSLHKLSDALGVQINLNEGVTKIMTENNRATGVLTTVGEYKADVIVSNMDIFSTYKRLLPRSNHPQKILDQERSSSALIFYWGIKDKFPELDLHNIFFSEDYPGEFAKLFEEKDLHNDPTVYVNITSKEDAADAPEGCENWFVMINAPGNFGQDWEQLKARARKNILMKLSRILNRDIEELIDFESVLEPITIEEKTSSHRGSLYGTSSNSKFSAFLRHANFSSRYKGLYFCGGSVHPGGGIPLCLLSAKIMTDLIPS
ncbi:MAG: phytoene desaturase [Saprospiraceae bacterium]|nr:phytoene desaturase [Saprospiraceae bacterium]